MFTKKTSQEKAASFKKKGDQHVQKGHYQKALKDYEKAKELDPQNTEVYDKLIQAHQDLEDQWTDEDFIQSLEWTMTQQEIKNPQIKRVHAKLTPEWKEVQELITHLLLVGSEEKENEYIEKIVKYKEQAIYPLIEVILSFKKIKNQ